MLEEYWIEDVTIPSSDSLTTAYRLCAHFIFMQEKCEGNDGFNYHMLFEPLSNVTDMAFMSLSN